MPDSPTAAEAPLPPVVATEQAVDMTPYAAFVLGKPFNRVGLIAAQSAIESSLTQAREKKVKDQQELGKNKATIDHNTRKIEDLEGSLPDQQRRLGEL